MVLAMAMGEVLLGILASVLIVSGGAALLTSLAGMSVVLYRRFKAVHELTAIPGEPDSEESVSLG